MSYSGINTKMERVKVLGGLRTVSNVCKLGKQLHRSDEHMSCIVIFNAEIEKPISWLNNNLRNKIHIRLFPQQ